MKKKCPTCQTWFDCMEDESCWCTTITAKLKQQQINTNCDCLCKHCLEKINKT